MIDFENEIYHKLSYMGARLSEQTQDALNNYFFKGWMPGGHLEAMLAHDLERALWNADSSNRQTYWALARWIRECAPEGSHGDYSNVDSWCNDINSCRSKWATWYELANKEEPKNYSF
jgi:hypothetical protein